MEPWAVTLLSLSYFFHMSVGGYTESTTSPTHTTSSEAGTGSLISDSGITTSSNGGIIDSQPEYPTSSELPPSAASPTPSNSLGTASNSTSHSLTETSITENLLLVLLLAIAAMVLISLIVLRFKCRNDRRQKREAKDGTSDQATKDKDQVTLISIRLTDEDAGDVSFGKNGVVENGKVDDLTRAQIHNE